MGDKRISDLEQSMLELTNQVSTLVGTTSRMEGQLEGLSTSISKAIDSRDETIRLGEKVKTLESDNIINKKWRSSFEKDVATKISSINRQMSLWAGGIAVGIFFFEKFFN